VVKGVHVIEIRRKLSILWVQFRHIGCQKEKRGIFVVLHGVVVMVADLY